MCVFLSSKIMIFYQRLNSFRPKSLIINHLKSHLRLFASTLFQQMRGDVYHLSISQYQAEGSIDILIIVNCSIASGFTSHLISALKEFPYDRILCCAQFGRGTVKMHNAIIHHCHTVCNFINRKYIMRHNY